MIIKAIENKLNGMILNRQALLFNAHNKDKYINNRILLNKLIIKHGGLLRYYTRLYTVKHDTNILHKVYYYFTDISHKVSTLNKDNK